MSTEIETSLTFGVYLNDLLASPNRQASNALRARLLAVQPSIIQRWDSGKRSRISAETLSRLIHDAGYQTSADVLLLWLNDKRTPPLDSPYPELIASILDLTEFEWKRLKKAQMNSHVIESSRKIGVDEDIISRFSRVIWESPALLPLAILKWFLQESTANEDRRSFIGNLLAPRPAEQVEQPSTRAPSEPIVELKPIRIIEPIKFGYSRLTERIQYISGNIGREDTLMTLNESDLIDEAYYLATFIVAGDNVAHLVQIPEGLVGLVEKTPGRRWADAVDYPGTSKFALIRTVSIRRGPAAHIGARLKELALPDPGSSRLAALTLWQRENMPLNSGVNVLIPVGYDTIGGLWTGSYMVEIEICNKGSSELIFQLYLIDLDGRVTFVGDQDYNSVPFDTGGELFDPLYDGWKVSGSGRSGASFIDFSFAIPAYSNRTLDFRKVFLHRIAIIAINISDESAEGSIVYRDRHGKDIFKHEFSVPPLTMMQICGYS